MRRMWSFLRKKNGLQNTFASFKQHISSTLEDFLEDCNTEFIGILDLSCSPSPVPQELTSGEAQVPWQRIPHSARDYQQLRWELPSLEPSDEARSVAGWGEWGQLEVQW